MTVTEQGLAAKWYSSRMVFPPKDGSLALRASVDPKTTTGERTITDKRGEERAAIQLRVDYKRLNTFFADYTKNISKGGTFIRTTKPLDVGTEFVFVLSVPSHNQQLDLRGLVIWVVNEEDSTADNPLEWGSSSTSRTTPSAPLVDEFVEKLMDEALGAHISTKPWKRPPI